MKMGDVVGIRGMKLSIGSGPDNSSVLTETNHDLTLLEHTVFLLVPMEGTFPLMRAHAGVAEPAAGGASGLSGATTANAAAAAALPALPDIDLCVPPQCDVALPAGNATAIGNAPDSISISQLGYNPRPQMRRWHILAPENYWWHLIRTCCCQGMRWDRVGGQYG
jgi:hypothetical protein